MALDPNNWLDIERYFYEGEWKSMPEIDQKRSRSVLENYRTLLTLGFNPVKPDFIKQYEARLESKMKDRTDAATIDKCHDQPVLSTSNSALPQNIQNNEKTAEDKCKRQKSKKKINDKNQSTEKIKSEGQKKRRIEAEARRRKQSKNKNAKKDNKFGKDAINKTDVVIDTNNNRNTKVDSVVKEVQPVKEVALVSSSCSSSLTIQSDLKTKDGEFVDLCDDTESHGESMPCKKDQAHKESVTEEPQDDPYGRKHNKVSSGTKCYEVFTSSVHRDEHNGTCYINDSGDSCDYNSSNCNTGGGSGGGGGGGRRRRRSSSRSSGGSLTDSGVVKVSFKCDQCSYESSHRGNFRMHLKIHTDEAPYKCDKCSYRSRQSANLQRHLKRHTQTKQSFKCNMCSFKCKWLSALRTHLLVHDNSRLFKCDRCDVTCKRSADLEKHIATHGRVPSRFNCKFCDYTSSRKENVDRHMRSHNDEKPYHCDRCDFKCSASNNLKVHMRSHYGNKLYKCNMCDYTSTHSSNLVVHLRLHAEEQPFKCNICCYTSNHSHSLTKHKIVCHGVSTT